MSRHAVKSRQRYAAVLYSPVYFMHMLVFVAFALERGGSNHSLACLEEPAGGYVHGPLLTRGMCMRQRLAGAALHGPRTPNFSKSTFVYIFSMGTSCVLHHATVMLQEDGKRSAAAHEQDRRRTHRGSM